MKKLNAKQMGKINGGMTASCALWLTEMGIVTTVAFMGSGPFGFLALGIFAGALNSDNNPC